ncbi:Glucan endo-1,3-beta-D-glucosidase [Platanthera guangdongensis]|uniref:Glucan endo-1,3-beta-D-glucosidase n=1 Tax=Platanthera guangdongensis TaxID=2320717 RepID=A0ABR2ME44_9ASPA
MWMTLRSQAGVLEAVHRRGLVAREPSEATPSPLSGHSIAISVVRYVGKVMVEACESHPAKNTWCVANPATSEGDLQNSIQFVCSSTDCSLIQYGSACFDLQTISFHASVAMNLYYQSVGKNSWNCYFGGLWHFCVDSCRLWKLQVC